MKIKHPLLPATLEVLQLLSTAGVDYLLIGAQARELLLYHVHDQSKGRATTDIDIVVMVEDWEGYQSLKEKLLTASNRIQTDRVQHRLNYQVRPTGLDGSPWQYRIDIIPFGGVEDPPGELRWPPSAEVHMNLAGCKEAWETAVSIEVGDGLRVRCASLPALALLKLMAWADRGTETSRDAEDLLLILRGYLDAGNSERVFDDLTPAAQTALDYDPDLMAATLLGKDIGSIAAPDTLNQLRSLMTDPTSRGRLLGAMQNRLRDEDQRTERLMNAFQLGVMAGPGQENLDSLKEATPPSR